MVTLVGILFTACFLFATLPQLVKVIRTKRVRDIHIGTYLLLLTGGVLGLVYLMLTSSAAVFVYLDYISCCIFSSLMLYYWFKYK